MFRWEKVGVVIGWRCLVGLGVVWWLEGCSGDRWGSGWLFCMFLGVLGLWFSFCCCGRGVNFGSLVVWVVLVRFGCFFVRFFVMVWVCFCCVFCKGCCDVVSNWCDVVLGWLVVFWVLLWIGWIWCWWYVWIGVFGFVCEFWGLVFLYVVIVCCFVFCCCM